MNSFHPARPFVYLVILGLNILLFAFQVVSGVDPTSPTTLEMIAWGANIPPLTLMGEPWRLLTSMFLHIGLIHVAANCYMLTVLGGIVEREFGSARFTLIYLLSGMFGSLASAMLATSFKVSAGASGALMGITGACLAHSLVAYLRDKQGVAAGLMVPLLQTIAINLAFGYFLKEIVDNAAHIGGLLAGAAIGGIFAVTRFNSALKRSLVAAMVTIASLALLHHAVNKPPSTKLIIMKMQLMEMARMPVR